MIVNRDLTISTNLIVVHFLSITIFPYFFLSINKSTKNIQSVNAQNIGTEILGLISFHVILCLLEILLCQIYRNLENGNLETKKNRITQSEDHFILHKINEI